MNEPAILVLEDESGAFGFIDDCLKGSGLTVLMLSKLETAHRLFSERVIAGVVCGTANPKASADVFRIAQAVQPTCEKFILAEDNNMLGLANIMEASNVSRVIISTWSKYFIQEMIESTIAFTGFEEVQGGESTSPDFSASLSFVSFSALQGLCKFVANVVDHQILGMRGHSTRVAKMAVMLGKALGLGGNSLYQLQIASLLHEIGYAMFPGKLWRPPELLTMQERQRLREHPNMGAKVLANTPGFEEIAQSVLLHHERVAGDGYPIGLEGDRIPLHARIIALVSYFDGCVHKVNAECGGTLESGLASILSQAGSAFDSELVALFRDRVYPTVAELICDQVEVSRTNLRIGMVIGRDVVNDQDIPLLMKNMELNELNINKILNAEIHDPVLCRIYVKRESLTENQKKAVALVEDKGVKKAMVNSARATIVAVDDEQNVINALKRELRIAGYQVEGFTNAMEALNYIANHDVCALISDFNMPGMKGDRFIMQAQRIKPGLPSLVLTGYATRENILNLVKQCELVHILSKPWDKQVLLGVLDKLRV